MTERTQRARSDSRQPNGVRRDGGLRKKSAEPESERLFGQKRGRLLTQAEETALAKELEDANRAVLDAIARSPVALGELFVMLDEVRDGTTDAADFAVAALEDPGARERMLRDVEAVARHVCGPSERLGRRRAFQEVRRKQFVATVLEYGLRDAATDRIIDHLVRERHARPVSDRPILDATILALRAGRNAADRARTALVEANIGLVIWMASKRRNAGLPLSDLVQEGSMGLMRAVEKFDYRRGLRFNTYAIWWVRQAINRALSDQSRTIRIPVHQLETRLKVAGIAREFAHEHGRDPTDAELARASGVPLAKVKALASIPKEPLSMDAPTGDEGDARLGDFVAEPDGTSALELVSRRDLVRHLRGLLGNLSARDAEVLKLRFGIDQPDCLTLSEIGARLSLSRERVRQIEAEALAKLRGPAAANDLRTLLVG